MYPDYVQHGDPRFAVCQIAGCSSVVRNTDVAMAQHASWHSRAVEVEVSGRTLDELEGGQSD